MANHAEILRYIDSIARDKEIDKEGLIQGIEQAMSLALAKKYGVDDVEIMLDRETGEFVCNYEVSMEEQGRIFAMSVKQAIISRVREAERDVIYTEYEAKLGEIVSGNIQRFEGDTVIVNLGRNLEGILPRSEKVRSENYNVGERIRALVYEVKKVGPRVKVILSRTHRDLVRAMFELEVPEIADGTIMIRRIEREPGYRTKLAVDSSDDKVDCVGACVGVRGTRIKNVLVAGLTQFEEFPDIEYLGPLGLLRRRPRQSQRVVHPAREGPNLRHIRHGPGAHHLFVARFTS